MRAGALAALLMLAACHRTQAPPPPALHVTGVEVLQAYQRYKLPPGTEFTIVHLERTPYVRKDDGAYDWIGSTGKDTSGNIHKPIGSSQSFGYGDSGSLFGGERITPTTAQLVFVLPRGTRLESVNVPRVLKLPGAAPASPANEQR